MIDRELVSRVADAVDSRLWSPSWHWERGPHGSLTHKGAEKMLSDLEGKLASAVARIAMLHPLVEEARKAVEEERQRQQD